MEHTVSTLRALPMIQVLQLAFTAMVAILFLQSSLDKLLNWKSEKEWLTGHFAKSILKGTVPLLLPILTVMELLAGACCALGLFFNLLGDGSSFDELGMLFGMIALLMLFLGQRLAKDYAGAASLVPYFLLTAAGWYALSF